ncbi:hypothetical protein [Pseudomonas sp. LRF_L74]|uniref:hypothetical protein n=1 Tax=Pseudomonas sp. LRF_L74 TaxID=3369422 RepID=UPI003F5E9962
MRIAASELGQYVIRPTLHYLGRNSPTAEALLLGIAACQSAMGEVLDDSQGYGLYRISANHHHQLWDEYLATDPDLASQHAFVHAPDLELVVNLRYSTAIAWMLVESKSLELPSSRDIHALGSVDVSAQAALSREIIPG